MAMDPNSQTTNDRTRPSKRGTQFGLKVLATGEHPKVDIVAIHGTDGKREDSWTADNGVLWLRSLLPERIPDARILTYGYDANTHGQEQLATEYIQGHATTFVAKLATFRKETLTIERPIIFVAHGSGGIMLKSALIHAHLCSKENLKHHQAIAHSTYGVAFFGTHHQGSATTKLSDFILDICRKFTSISLLQHLERDSEVLQQQLSHYPAVSIDFDTKFFYELYDTQIGVFKKAAPKNSAVVPGTINAEAIGINKDHVNMIKFESADDEDFKTVSGVLCLMSQAAPQKIDERWEHARRARGATIPKEIPRSSNHTSLKYLPRVDAARFDADDRPRCLEGTRVELLKMAFTWVERDNSRGLRRVFWLCGQAGTGKTTISLTVAGGCERRRRLGASFFFSRDNSDRNDLRLVFPSLAQQLGSYHAPFRALLAEILERDPGLAYIDPEYQFRKLIIEPLIRCPNFPSAVIVIDALDECRDDKPISKMLEILSAHIHDFPCLKFFITSRPEVHIQNGFRQLGIHAESIILHNIDESVVDGDIEHYLRNRFSTMTIVYPYLMGSDWPSAEVIKTLVAMAGRLFIFAATAMNFILDPTYGDPYGQLDTLLKQSPVNNPSSPFIFLDHLYLQVLRQAFPLRSTPSDRLALIRRLLGVIVLLRTPLSPGALESLLRLRKGNVRTTLRHLHSVIIVPETDEHPIRLIHPSFFDFATSRCSDLNFHINSSICHDQLAVACFEQMKNLKRNICNIQDPSKLNSEIEDLADRVKQYIPPSMQYACRYWSYHMCNATKSSLTGLLETFSRTQVLYWIEAVSLIDSLRDGIRQINAIINFLNGLPPPPKKLLMSLKDVARFIVDYFDVVSVASLQLYRTALPLAPKSIYLPFKHEAKGGMQVLQGGELDSSEVTTLRGSYGDAGSVEFSPNGELIICTALDAILVWDRGTGTLLTKLTNSEDDTFPTWARVFPDGRRVISGSDKYTLRIWNIETGICLETIQLERSNSDIELTSSYTCSPDFTCIVGTEGNNLLLWNTCNGAVLNIFSKHSKRINAVAFSPNGLFIASGSEDRTICLWDAVKGIARVLRGHSSSVFSVAFSPNNRYLISGARDIRLWDVSNGVTLHTLKGHTSSINSIAFSPDSASIISGSADETLRVWNVAQGKILKTINCSGSVENARISPNGMQYIMSILDIYVWDSDHIPNFDRFKKNSHTVRFSLDGTHIIFSNKRDIYLMDGLTGVLLEKLKGHSDLINSLAFAPNGKCFASGSDDRTIRLWDMPKRRASRVMTGHSRGVSSVTFSPDSTSIVSASLDLTIRIWDVASGNNVFTIHTSIYAWGPEFSPNGSQIVTCDSTYDIPLQFRSYSACLNSKGPEELVYLKYGGWIFVNKAGDTKRCVWMPGAWRLCSTSLSQGRVAIGTPDGLVLLDLSGITLFI